MPSWFKRSSSPDSESGGKDPKNPRPFSLISIPPTTNPRGTYSTLPEVTETREPENAYMSGGLEHQPIPPVPPYTQPSNPNAYSKGEYTSYYEIDSGVGRTTRPDFSYRGYRQEYKSEENALTRYCRLRWKFVVALIVVKIIVIAVVLGIYFSRRSDYINK